MNKEELKARYDKMVSGIEQSKIYDGRGTYDLYRCRQCPEELMTTYADKGVTPFVISCKCGGDMIHEETYRHIHPSIKVEKFVRPTFEQMLKMNDGQIEHVLNGGLIRESTLLKN